MKIKTRVVRITPSAAYDMGAGPRAAAVTPDIALQEELEANFVAVWFNSESDPVVFASFDLLYVGQVLRDAVIRAANLPQDRVFIAASHTHRAPMTDPSKPKLGAVSSEYMKWLTAEVSSAVAELLNDEDASSVDLFAGQGAASHSINRRLKKRFLLAKRPRFNFIANAPNPLGPRDEVVSVVSFRDSSGRAIAHLWNYACHPVAHPWPSLYSSHYVHHARRALRTDGDETCAVIFLQGFSGNTRPSASAGARSIKERIRRMFSGPLFDNMSEKTYLRWTKSLADVVRETAESSDRIESNFVSSRRIEVEGHQFATDLERPVAFHRIQFGTEISVVAAAAEVVVEYAAWVRNTSKTRITMCVGCIDDSYGYLPTTTILNEGGYEGGEFTPSFGIGSLTKSVESNAKNAFQAVMSDSRGSEE